MTLVPQAAAASDMASHEPQGDAVPILGEERSRLFVGGWRRPDRGAQDAQVRPKAISRVDQRDGTYPGLVDPGCVASACAHARIISRQAK